MDAKKIIYDNSYCLISKSVFHLAISNMAQGHVAFCERHVALHECHVPLHERHLALHERHVMMLPFTVICLFELLLRNNQPTQAIVTVENNPVTHLTRSHL